MSEMTKFRQGKTLEFRHLSLAAFEVITEGHNSRRRYLELQKISVKVVFRGEMEAEWVNAISDRKIGELLFHPKITRIQPQESGNCKPFFSLFQQPLGTDQNKNRPLGSLDIPEFWFQEDRAYRRQA